ncbi:TPA: AAA family ATPase [Bacillus cereus]|nr:AAA family ATPase [Bacillus cereus]
MKLIEVEIKNFRLLKEITNEKSMHLNEKTTVLVGKNNSGKTSFSYIFDVFLNEKKFDFEDFSISCHKIFEKIFSNYCSLKREERELEDFFLEDDSTFPSIELVLTIEYDEKDNWNNIRPLLTSLDDTNLLKVAFKYGVERPKIFLEKLKELWEKKKEKESLIDCVKKIYKEYFITTITPVSAHEQVERININDVKKIIGSYHIAAQRHVEDGNSQTNSKLSPVFQKEYQTRQKNDSDNNVEETVFLGLNDAIENANSDMDEKLKEFFNEFMKSFSTFGFPNIEGADLILKSNVTPTNLFKGIKLLYKDKESLLPEKYNGLGFSNLIYIISEILSFNSKCKNNPTDLNLIFIEEPEAHMHPQLQNTFILKLNEFLAKNNINAQIIISTHSSHIVSNADFESIRYFCRGNEGTVVKDLMKFKLKTELPTETGAETEIDTINFLKQYITLVKCDMFFADKIILIEGATERLLMPLFIEKIDKELKEVHKIKLLSEQYISVIEVGGAYMHKFKEFLDFLSVKALIITDIDSCLRETRGKHEITQDELSNLITSNQTLINWMPKEESIGMLIYKDFESDIEGNINISYQRRLKGFERVKCGRSFEEAFIIDNSEYIMQHNQKINSLKNHLKNYDSSTDIINNSYKIYEYIANNKKKTDFAFDLLYINNGKWNVPDYIKEGLIWLAK